MRSTRPPALVATVLLALALPAACKDANEPTAARAADGAVNLAAVAAAADGAATLTQVTALGTLPLPVNQSVSYSGTALRITNTGAGGAGGFLVSNSSSSAVALLGQTNGRGPAVKGTQTGTSGNAGYFQVTNAANSKSALYAANSGGGTGGWFEILNSGNARNAVYAKTPGGGSAVRGEATGFGTAGTFVNTNASNGANTVYVQSSGSGQALSAVNLGPGHAGLFTKVAGTDGSAALRAANAGSGPAVYGENTSTGIGGEFVTAAGREAVAGRQRGLGSGGVFQIHNAGNSSAAVSAMTTGSGWAGDFTALSASGRGVRIQTFGGAGLQVAGGTKNAVVTTSAGARELYTEESSEVWFTDYGFARLTSGRARILLDPTFAETIETGAPYHVFVEPYGDASLYVAERTPLGFVVRRRDGAPDVEFSYRVVAKRRGFAGKRLDRAPWADASAARSTGIER